tara:strand:+ start:782 stop:1117 length:336 start_codon:yes stop_codon:yes gene_type:complete
MADCYAHEAIGRLSCFAASPEQVQEHVAERFGEDMTDWGRVLPLQVETAKSRHADELYQVLRDLTSMAKLGVPISCINTYLAAIRNAEQLLEKVDNESTEDPSNGQQSQQA